MRCTHKTHHDIACFLLGVLLIAGSLGTLRGLSGKNAVDRVGAQKLLQRAEQRRERREKRLGNAGRVVRDIGRTYPMQASTLLLQNLSERFDVQLGVGFVSYPMLNIAAPVNKPSLLEWENRNWRGLEEQMQFGLLHGVVAYPHSPALGKGGNIIIAGHSSAPTLEARSSAYQDIFATLPNAVIGDRIELRDGLGVPFIYEVFETRIAEASETKILLQDTTKNELTLFTCFPVGTTKQRFLVRAKLVNGKSLAAR